jgi:hypothetical protein
MPPLTVDIDREKLLRLARANDRGADVRKGQALWNVASVLFPEKAHSIVGGYADPYYPGSEAYEDITLFFEALGL